MLEELNDLDYPKWLADAASFLPDINLACVATSGMNFLNDAVTDSTTATVTGFLNAISTGCSNKALSLAVSGGYNNTMEELGNSRRAHQHLLLNVLVLF